MKTSNNKKTSKKRIDKKQDKSKKKVKDNVCNLQKDIDTNSVKKIKTFFKESNNNKRKNGSALTENVLLVAISVVIVVSIFYPQIVSLLRQVMQSLSSWFTLAINQIGVV